MHVYQNTHDEGGRMNFNLAKIHIGLTKYEEEEEWF
jgi:hypothetical protein